MRSRKPQAYILRCWRTAATYVSVPKIGCTTVIKFVALADGYGGRLGVSFDSNKVRFFGDIHRLGRAISYASRAYRQVHGGPAWIVYRYPHERILSAYCANYGDERWGLRSKFQGILADGFSFRDLLEALAEERISAYADSHLTPISGLIHPDLLSSNQIRGVHLSKLTEVLNSHAASAGVALPSIAINNKTKFSNEKRPDASRMERMQVVSPLQEGGSLVRARMSDMLGDQELSLIQDLYFRDYQLIERLEARPSGNSFL